MIWYNTVSIGPFQFDIEFIKVNPLTNRLNYATSKIYVNGKLGHTYWYSDKKELIAQIESAKLIDNYLASFDDIKLTTDELHYLFDEEGQFSKISHLFSFNHSYSFRKFLESGIYKKGYFDYMDHNCLLGNDPQERYHDVTVDLDNKNNIVYISYKKWINNSFQQHSKTIAVPYYFLDILKISFILSILFNSFGIIRDYEPITEWNLGSLICIPSDVGGYFDTYHYKQMIKKYNLLKYNIIT